ncbi:hypothetical protein ANME2D_00723 [Candidatus Methanoperedens nitroreducens]|uniref:Uncharacterized protein n=1 Tax=Candidatus Methanoperedens nitratireducens TaxID=1392998 RepID=A0A062V3I4_9EURY|nr:hypothetical protein ANME2D_00723 [Candidatus Methanoperedens nitroreducens]
MKRIYIRIIGFIMCIPFIYALYFCTVTQPTLLIIPCILGGSTLAPYVVIALAIGLYLLITG